MAEDRDSFLSDTVGEDASRAGRWREVLSRSGAKAELLCCSRACWACFRAFRLDSAVARAASAADTRSTTGDWAPVVLPPCPLFLRGDGVGDRGASLA